MSPPFFLCCDKAVSAAANGLIGIKSGRFLFIGQK